MEFRLVMIVVLIAALGGQPSYNDAAPAQSWCDHLPRPEYRDLERIDSEDDWFEVYRVADGVYAIYEPFQFQEVISYLIAGSEGALLFDTGMGIGSIGAVARKLVTVPIRVLNSHTHYDHVGGNAEFDDILALDTPYTRRSARGTANEDVRGQVVPGALCRELPRGVDPASYRIRPFEIDELIGDGHIIDLGGRRLEVLTTPGHTPDSVMLLDRGAGLLWTGDTFYRGPIWLIAEETDLDAYGASLQRMAELVPDLEMVLPAHNIPVAEPSQLTALLAAFKAVRNGSHEPDEVDGGRLLFEFDGFSFLIGADQLR